ncbi:MAG: SDR family oxidoreductase, partial [Chthonomonadales bacterium]
SSDDVLKVAISKALAAYKTDYKAYYDTNKLPDSPAMRSPAPTVALVPGIGMFSFGKNKPEARITGEFYVNAINVMAGATAMVGLPPQTDIPGDRIVDNYVALPPAEAFGIEYWLLEEAKLQRMPAEKELSRKVALVVGVSPGIGSSICAKLAVEGAHVIAADMRPEFAADAANLARQKGGKEAGLELHVDCTDRASVAKMFEQAALHFGGVDIVVQAAAVFFPPDASTGTTTDAEWRKTIDINLVGSMIVADEAQKHFAAQGVDGNIILLSSANAVVPKKGSFAYDTGKAALNHLIRELAVSYAPKTRVNGVAPASVVEGSVQFPRDRVMTSLEKYGIEFSETESTEELRDKLSRFYSERTLLKKKVSPTNIAEAVFLLASQRLELTTGQVLAVDAGLPEAFLR